MTELATVPMNLPGARQRLRAAQELLQAARSAHQAPEGDRPAEAKAITESVSQLLVVASMAAADVISAKALRRRSATGTQAEVLALLEESEPDHHAADLLRRILEGTDLVQRLSLAEDLYRSASRAI